MKHLPQHGGEGKEKYKGKKSDMHLGQLGGEGHAMKGKDGKLMDSKDMGESYCGPGRYLKTEK